MYWQGQEINQNTAKQLCSLIIILCIICNYIQWLHAVDVIIKNVDITMSYANKTFGVYVSHCDKMDNTVN